MKSYLDVEKLTSPIKALSLELIMNMSSEELRILENELASVQHAYLKAVNVLFRIIEYRKDMENRSEES